MTVSKFSKKIKQSIFIISCIIYVSFSVFAQTFSGTGLPVTVPDSTGGCGGTIGAATNGISCVTIPVSGVAGNLSSLTTSFTVGTDPATWMGDYAIVLYAPGGSPSLTLMNNTGANPPNAGGCGDSTNINSGTVVTFGDTGSNLPTTVAGLSSTVTVPTGTYAPSSGTTSPSGSINSTFYGLTPAQQNGNWQMCFYDLSGSDTMSISAVNLNLNQVPTASDGYINGRVVNKNGRGISKALIYLTDTFSGETRSAMTNSFGYFNFKDLPIGSFYIMSVNKKGYNFDTQSFNLTEGLDSLQIIGY
jgi:hypothetical protein